ncbi:helix-turn-helix domain-containing protein [Peribacillus deserti]|uniref:Helix-turn-helix domain-containing protein n=1 Tax=Peribacillus deserti TaxID=673318 RepID=A0A2N5MBC8_9BACI|nr:RodZ domain-containing protein [Peribacillus deserti]PLT31615.1 helix-turn-helix domain-containing protein [Peribacillus deserti]
MTELGIRLKEEREAKGLSLDDLQKVTKIQKRYLVGIEEGNYDMMPGKFYVRAFIKQYAEAVGLEPEEIFEVYKNDIPVTYNEELPQQLSRVQTRKMVAPSNSKVLEALPKILVSLFVIGAAVLVWVLVSKSSNDPTSNKVDETNQPVNYEESKDSPLKKKNGTAEKDAKKEKEKKAAEQTKPEQEVKPEIKVVNSEGRNSTFSLNHAKDFKLKVLSTGETWVNIKNSQNKSLYQGILTKTQSKEFDLTKDPEANLVIGNTTQTEIYINGEKLQYAVSPQSSVSQNIKVQFKPVQ